MTLHGKLVRDRVPELIAAHGKMPHVRVLDDAEYTTRLDEKLVEEVAEYLASGDLEELVDILEVIHALLAHRQVSLEAFAHQCAAKRADRGGFAQRWLLLP